MAKEPLEVEIDGKMKTLKPEEADRLKRFLLQKAMSLLSEDDIEGAKLECALALKIDEKDVEALMLFGDISKAEGKLDQSIGFYQAAYEFGGRNIELVSRLLSGYLILGDFIRGKHYATELTLIDPENKAGWKNLTEIQILEGELEHASAHLKSWVDILGETDETEYYYAVIQWKRGERQNAYERFNHLAERGTTLGQVYHFLSVYHFDREEYRETIPYLERYLELEGPDDEAEAVLEECYMESSNR